ncbi:hypothetical protein [Mycobacterium xenopi]|uniref:hypothetical protein n=1 Tax=Mycobacterium xenopi TaxID=1789 RepID=UPI001E28F632|nr:hypothetical protein [Mycobacterium xenopi]MDA3638016.1 hypothetical protein [Mycobacterium xenopi]MDA3656085.1 hypothetical protein [Mycobacterium xenopi]MDA3660596.1 hypothetical protein [Mycobacterium xenopi]
MPRTVGFAAGAAEVGGDAVLAAAGNGVHLPSTGGLIVTDRAVTSSPDRGLSGVGSTATQLPTVTSAR